MEISISNRLNGRLNEIANLFKESGQAYSILLDAAKNGNPRMMRGKNSRASKKNILKGEFSEKIRDLLKDNNNELLDVSLLNDILSGKKSDEAQAAA
jgi:tRNA A22 N-methylase